MDFQATFYPPPPEIVIRLSGDETTYYRVDGGINFETLTYEEFRLHALNKHTQNREYDRFTAMDCAYARNHFGSTEGCNFMYQVIRMLQNGHMKFYKKIKKFVKQFRSEEAKQLQRPTNWDRWYDEFKLIKK